jgi:hypothetical protein
MRVVVEKMLKNLEYGTFPPPWWGRVRERGADFQRLITLSPSPSPFKGEGAFVQRILEGGSDVLATYLC